MAPQLDTPGGQNLRLALGAVALLAKYIIFWS